MFIQLGGGGATIAIGETLAAKIIAGAGTLDKEEQQIISGLASILKQLPISIASYGFAPKVRYGAAIREFLFSLENAGKKRFIPFYGLCLFSPAGLEHITISYDGTVIPPQAVSFGKGLWRIVAGHLCLEISTRKPSEIRLPEKVKELEDAEIGFKEISDKTIR